MSPALVLAVDRPFAVLVALLFAAVALWGARETIARRRAIETTEVVDAGTAVPGERIAVRGTVRCPPQGRCLSSPVRRRDCVFAAWAIDDYVGHEWASGGGWTEQVEEYETVPFLVDDGTGQVLVALEDGHDVTDTDVWFELSAYDEAVSEVGPEETPPSHLRDVVASHDDVDERRLLLSDTLDFDYPHGYRRFREATLEPGDEVYVAGEAVRTSSVDSPASLSAGVAVKRPGDDDVSHLILTDEDPSDLASHTGGVALVLLVFGVGLLLWVVNELTVGLLPLLRPLV